MTIEETFNISNNNSLFIDMSLLDDNIGNYSDYSEISSLFFYCAKTAHNKTNPKEVIYKHDTKLITGKNDDNLYIFFPKSSNVAINSNILLLNIYSFENCLYSITINTKLRSIEIIDFINRDSDNNFATCFKRLLKSELQAIIDLYDQYCSDIE